MSLARYALPVCHLSMELYVRMRAATFVAVAPP